MGSMKQARLEEQDKAPKSQCEACLDEFEFKGGEAPAICPACAHGLDKED